MHNALTTPATSADSARASGRWAGITLGGAAAATGLLAGVYYAYSTSVMPGLAQTGDRAFVDTMQQINIAIVNPAFLAAFLGAPALTLAALLAGRRLRSARWTAAALALNVIGLGVSTFANIPLNDQLQQAGDPRHLADPAAVRAQFEAAWVAWNVVRGLLTAGALLCLGRALMLNGQRPY